MAYWPARKEASPGDGVHRYEHHRLEQRFPARASHGLSPKTVCGVQLAALVPRPRVSPTGKQGVFCPIALFVRRVSIVDPLPPFSRDP
jgi:hypothetical protein